MLITILIFQMVIFLTMILGISEFYKMQKVWADFFIELSKYIRSK